MVYLLLADGFEEIEALTVVDVLRRGGEEIKTLSISGETSVIGAHSIVVKADDLLKNSDLTFDTLVLPGGMPGTINLDKSKIVDKILDYAIENNKLIAAICAAPSILGKRGYLCGKKATCYPSFETELKGADVKFDKVVHDGNFITSRGAGTASDFAKEILATLKGKEIAEKVIDSMLY